MFTSKWNKKKILIVNAKNMCAHNALTHDLNTFSRTCGEERISSYWQERRDSYIYHTTQS